MLLLFSAQSALLADAGGVSSVARNGASGDNQNHYILTTATSLGELLSLANGAPTSSKSTKSKTAKSTRRISIGSRI